jgi:YD repeat-containing protein
MNKMRKNKLAKAIVILIIAVLFVNSTSAFAVAAEMNNQHQEKLKLKKILDADLNENSPELEDMLKQEEEKPVLNFDNSEAKEIDLTFSLKRAQSEYFSSRFIIKYKDASVLDKHNVPDEGTYSDRIQLEARKATLKEGIRQQLNGNRQVMIKNRDTGEEELAVLALEKVEALAVDTAIVEFDGEITAGQLSRELSDNTIDYIQPDYAMMVAGSDPLLEEQWGHYQVYQPEGSELSSYRMDANVTEAWSTAQGAGALVALIDGGIDIEHPDLMDSIWHNPNETLNGLDDDGNGYIDDICGWDFFNDDNSVNDLDNKYDQWHSTHLAGIIAAQKDNSIGIAGVAPQAKILPLKVFEGGVAYTSDIIKAIEYAEMMGAQIANCSWGSLYENPALKAAIEGSSMLFVCAVGNSLFDLDKYPTYPACFGLDNIISVTSIDQDGRFSRFANYGTNNVDTAAPGRDILSTWIDEEYQVTSGTSMSAGYVSGAAALLAGQNQGMSAPQIKKRLIDSGDMISGLQNKVKDGKKLNCAYAVSSNIAPNPTVIDIPDPEPLPIITPMGPMEDDNYEEYGADGFVSSRNPMPEARHGLQVVAIGTKIYAIGGYDKNGSPSKRVDVYDTEMDAWSTAANMGTARAYFGAVAWQGKIYVFGGASSASPYTNTVEIYNPSNNSWGDAATSLPLSMRSFSTSLDPENGKVYLVGGYNNSGYRNSVYEGTISNNNISWTAKTNIGIAVSDHVAVYYKDSYNNRTLRVIGGATGYATKPNTDQVYDIAAGPMGYSTPSILNSVNGAGVITYDHFIGIGGAASNSNYNINYSNVISNIRLFSGWHAGGYTPSHMSTPRSGLGAVLVGNKVYMMGGRDANRIFSLVEVFELGWEDKGTLPFNLRDFKTMECNGRLYVIGGYNTSGQMVNSVYEYDPASSNWEQKASIPVFIDGFALTNAYGKVYLIGGSLNWTATSSVYEFDPIANIWEQKANMPNGPRVGLAACFYKGKIYAIGGVDSSGFATNRVEIYDPLASSVGIWTSVPVSGGSQGIGYPHAFISNETIYAFNKDVPSTVYVFNGNNNSWQSITAPGSWFDTYSNAYVNINDTVYILHHPSSLITSPQINKYHSQDNIWSYYSTFNFFGRINDAAALNNEAYIFTGDNAYCTRMVKYSPKISPWTPKCDMDISLEQMGAAVIGDTIYVAGGVTGDIGIGWYRSDLRAYDMNSNSWTTKTPMAYNRWNLALETVNGKLYAIGGQSDPSGYINYVEEYNPATNSWTNKTPSTSSFGPTARMASAVYNDEIYLFGGENPSSGISTVKAYKPSTNSWVTKTSLPTAVIGAGAATLNGKIYVAGGDSIDSNSLRIYDPVTNSWDPSPKGMPAAMRSVRVVAGENSIYIIGVVDIEDNNMNYSYISPLVYEYNPTLDKWFTWQGPDFTRSNFGFVMTSKGLYALGGTDLFTTTSSVEFAPISELEQANDYLHMGDDQINPSGNFSRTFVDLSYTAPGFNVNVSRTYNSLDKRTSLFSPGWSFGFQGKLDSEGNYTVVRLPDGSGQSFKATTSGSNITYTAKDSRSKLERLGSTSSTYNYLLTTQDQYKYHFNNAGFMDYMEDRNGNRITIAFNPSYPERITSITDQAGKVTTVAYSGSQISSITDPAGRITSYSYSSGRLSQVTDPTGDKAFYEYYYDSQTNNYYLSVIKKGSATATLATATLLESVAYGPTSTYEPDPKVKTITDANGKIENYTYDKSEGSVTVTDNGSPARTTATWYDKMLYPIRFKDSEGRQTYIEYNLDGGINRYGEVKRQTDRNGNSTYYERNSQGNVTKVVNPDGSYRKYEYNSKNDLLWEKDEVNTATNGELGSATYYDYTYATVSGVQTSRITSMKKARRLSGTQDYSPSVPQGNFAK